MKIKIFFLTLFLSIGLGMTCATLSSCSAGAHVGPIGAGASID